MGHRKHNSEHAQATTPTPATVTTSAPMMTSAPLTAQSAVAAEVRHERWAHWPIHWSGINAGALASVAAVIIFGLSGIALGAHFLTPENRVTDLKKMEIGALAFSVFSAFLAFAIGGWVAAKIAGILHSEPAMIHGALSWLVSLPILIILSGIGAGSSLGAWHAAMVTPTSSTGGSAASGNLHAPDPVGANATEEERTEYKKERDQYRRKTEEWEKDSPKVARNAALGALTALLLGLMGSVVGGWMASGEPMSLTYRRSTTSSR